MATKTDEKTAVDKLTAARNKNLDLAIQQIAKDYGEGAIMRLGDEKIVDIDVIPTGNILIDRALGVGGFPRGRVVEVFGPESSGKTTLTLTVISQAQKRGGLAAFIDVEHALDPAYAKRLGVNLDDLLVSQPSSGEEALRICETLIRSNALDVIVVDSVAALVTRAELEGEIGDTTVGAQARLMSAALRKLTSLISKARTCCIFTNQIREKIGVMFGNPETTPGGKALKFYASVRVDIRRIGAIKQTHGVATIEGQLRKDVGLLDLLRATFPGGSVTGAPKIRAMEIIEELEPVRRGPYTGCLGYLGFNRESQLSILIRTAICKEGRAYFHAGAGIVADSKPEAEYEETLTKARGFLQAIPPGSAAPLPLPIGWGEG